MFPGIPEPSYCLFAERAAQTLGWLSFPTSINVLICQFGMSFCVQFEEMPRISIDSIHWKEDYLVCERAACIRILASCSVEKHTIDLLSNFTWHIRSSPLLQWYHENELPSDAVCHVNHPLARQLCRRHHVNALAVRLHGDNNIF